MEETSIVRRRKTAKPALLARSFYVTSEHMCGIVGLFAKAPAIEERLGVHLAAMLAQMNDRGPDSAGVAVYREPARSGSSKLTLYSADLQENWAEIAAQLGVAFGGSPEPNVRASHAVLVVDADAEEAEAWVRAHRPDLRVMSAGRVIEIYKETGLPRDFAEQFRLTDLHGTHALGHTRMATESRVTTEGSHPFSTGLDLCLVHNGSLSNHNRLREKLRREGIEFQTENDTEVAAGYLAWRMREGATLEQALEGCLDDLDGFYTFAVGTADGFAVLRDPIACKPAVLAETDDWVAMGSEWRALAVLPGSAEARMWEPQPGVVYVWERETVAA
jgi:methylamine---glutamate N-methyltransferase subunit A